MSQYQNAAAGIHKIYTAEIISLVGTILVSAATIIGVVTSANSELGLQAIAALLGIVGLLVSLVGFVLNIVGLKTAAEDEKCFKTALNVILLSLILVIVVNFLKNSVLQNAISSLGPILDYLAAYFVILGISNLVPESSLAVKGKKVIKIAAVIAALDTICVLAQSAEKFTLICSNAAAVCAVLYYLIYIGFLREAKELVR